MKWTGILNSHDIAVHETGPQVMKTETFSPRAGLRYNTGNLDSSNLPKLKLNNFDGNPLEWPEWSSMFIATVDQRPIPDSEKMSYLKTLLTSKARSTVSGKGYSGQFYGAAWSNLERKFQGLMWSLRNWRVFAKQNRLNITTNQVWSVSQLLSQTLCMCSKSTSRLVYLQSSSTLYRRVDKLPQVLKEKWFYVDQKYEDWPDLIMFEKWLSRIAFVHKGFSAFKGERREEDRRSTNRNKQF